MAMTSPASFQPSEALHGRLERAFANLQGPCTLVTDGTEAPLNAIWVTNLKYLSTTSQVAICDNAFDKTRRNLLCGSRATFLLLTPEGPLQIKGPVTYMTEGPEFEDAQAWGKQDFPLKGLALLQMEEVWSGAEKLT